MQIREAEQASASTCSKKNLQKEKERALAVKAQAEEAG
jgi:hypothetical protein